jgi:NAD(P)H-hydrate epimerase
MPNNEASYRKQLAELDIIPGLFSKSRSFVAEDISLYGGGGGGEVGRWGDGEMGNSPAPTTDREWGLGAMGRWGV